MQIIARYPTICIPTHGDEVFLNSSLHSVVNRKRQHWRQGEVDPCGVQEILVCENRRLLDIHIEALTTYWQGEIALQ